MPFSPPPPGGFLRGSSIELEETTAAGKQDEIVDYESTGSDDVIVLIPEKERPPRELDLGLPVAPSDARRSAFASTSTSRTDGSLQRTNESQWQSRSPGLPYHSSSKWSGRKKSTSLAVTGMFCTSPPSTSPTQPTHPADIDIRYAQDVSALRKLSLEDRQPTPPRPSAADRPSSFDELDFSPPSALLAEFPKIEPSDHASKSPPLGTERNQADLETDAAQPTYADELPSPNRQTTVPAQPDVQDLASHSTEDAQPSMPSPRALNDPVVEMTVHAPEGWPVSGPELPPLAYLPRDYESISDPTLVEDDTLKAPYAAAAEEGIVLVSERMGLGCVSLTPDQADRLMMREFAMRKSGIPPMEWAWADEADELAHDSLDDWDENDEGWDSDELEMLTYRVVAPPPRPDSGQLFGDKDETGILEP